MFMRTVKVIGEGEEEEIPLFPNPNMRNITILSYSNREVTLSGLHSL